MMTKYHVNYEELERAHKALDDWGVIPYPIAFPNEVTSRVLAAVLPQHDRELLRRVVDVWADTPGRPPLVDFILDYADSIQDWNPKDDR